MTTINLKDHYPWYTEDAFIEVSDEVAAFLEEDRRLQINYAQYIRDNKAFYSLDAGDGIEAEALNLPEQPDEALERMELERLLKEALAQLTETQRRRLLVSVLCSQLVKPRHLSRYSLRLVKIHSLCAAHGLAGKLK